MDGERQTAQAGVISLHHSRTNQSADWWISSVSQPGADCGRRGYRLRAGRWVMWCPFGTEHGKRFPSRRKKLSSSREIVRNFFLASLALRPLTEIVFRVTGGLSREAEPPSLKATSASPRQGDGRFSRKAPQKLHTAEASTTTEKGCKT